MVELFNSNYDAYLWRRLKIIVSEDIGLATGLAVGTIADLHKFYLDQKEEKNPKKPERMFLVHAVLYLCRCPKSRLVDWTIISAWREEHSMVNHPVPEYAFDMHNLKGKQRGFGIDHFFEKGTVLNNHKLLDGEEESKIRAKKAIESMPKPMLFYSPKEAKQTDMFAETHGLSE